MKKQSTKRAKQNREYLKARKEYLEENPFCEARFSEQCNYKANQIHHKNSRNGDRLNDTAYFMAVCYFCHCKIHSEPAKSRELGYLI
jgi:hypothetical protein